ncbi:MAG: T9SS type A sorting domain-containing protein, partial [Bacteroidia bacterium]
TFSIDPNPYDCLPNHITAMNSTDLAVALCAAGNTNGCSVAGIEQIKDNIQASIYPNPTNSNFTIELNTSNKQTLQIFDVNGKMILTQTINAKTNIDASNLAVGVYNLSLISTSGVANKRLVIVR